MTKLKNVVLAMLIGLVVLLALGLFLLMLAWSKGLLLVLALFGFFSWTAYDFLKGRGK